MASDTFASLTDSQRSAVAAAEIGYGFLDQSRFGEALAAFRRAIELWPENAVYWYDLARSFREVGAYEQGLTVIDEAIRLNPEEPQFHHARGNIKRSLKDLGGAVEEFKRALALDSAFPAHNNLGLTYHELGELALARDVLEIGLNLAPEDTDLIENLSSVVYNLDRFAVAAMCDQRLTELDPARSTGWSRLANDLLRIERFAGAEQAIAQAISLGGRTAENLSLLAEILLKLGRVREAEEARVEAQKVGG